MANEAEDKSGKKEEETPIKVILLGDSAVGIGLGFGRTLPSRTASSHLQRRQPSLLVAGKSKLVERFLMDGYQPQQLSTYALTLFGYEAKRDGKTVCLSSTMHYSSQTRIRFT